jgi:sugar phosphate isomerase/epimerase
VRIALHAFYFQDRLVRGVAELARIVNAFPSACNGVLYCGGLHIPGDDVADSVRTFQGRIFLAHARDVKGSRFLKESDCVEVPLGEGDVNLAGMIAALQAAGYQGMICPEHLGPPRSPGEDQLGIAVRHLRDFLTRR